MEKLPTRINELLAFLDKQREEKIFEGDAWGIDTDRQDRDTQYWSNLFPYDRTFAPFLRELKTFKALALERKKQFGTASFLDLFGSGKFIAETATPTAVLGIRSMDIASQGERQLRPSWWQVIEGNLFDLCSMPAELLLQIEGFLLAQKIEHFDFITCRPFGPFENYRGKYTQFIAEEYSYVYYLLLKQVCQFLSPKGGKLFTVLPEYNMDRSNFVVLIRYLKERGYKIRVSKTDSYYYEKKDTAMLVERSPQSMELEQRPAFLA
mgnify:CR=1 FL=1